MWTLLGKLLLGLPGIAGGVINVLNKRADTDLARYQTAVGADVALNQGVFQAWVSAQKDMAASRAADRGSWWTAWMMPVGFLVAVSHYAAVTLDSMPLFGHVVGSWGIAALPGSYAKLQETIIYSAAGVMSVQSVSGAVRRIFSK